MSTGLSPNKAKKNPTRKKKRVEEVKERKGDQSDAKKEKREASDVEVPGDSETSEIKTKQERRTRSKPTVVRKDLPGPRSRKDTDVVVTDSSSEEVARKRSSSESSDQPGPRLPRLILERDDVPNVPTKLSDHLGKPLWWLVYINPKDHAEALAGDANPAELYDRQQSPGYRQSIENALDLLFEQIPRLLTLDADFYRQLHDLAIAHLDTSKIKEPMAAWSTGDPAESTLTGGTVKFPMSHDPKRVSVAEDLLTETVEIAGEDVHILVPAPEDMEELQTMALMANGKDARRYACISGLMGVPANIHVNYRRADAPVLVEAVGTRFGYELENARTGRERLAAIAKLIRALHVLHPFIDANGRTNITLLLTKLLLDNGYPPTILENMDDLFSGTFTVDEMVEQIEAGFNAFQNARERETERQLVDGEIPALGLTLPAAEQKKIKKKAAPCCILF